MNYHLTAQVRLFVILLSLFPSVRFDSTDEPIVRALLFYSPTCPHCHKVITEDLPAIIDEFGEQVLILAVNTYTEEGHELFVAAVNHFNLSNEQRGVPMMVIGENILIGSNEIPQQLPEIISRGLETGGIDWPDIPGLAQLLEDEPIAGPNETNPTEGVIEEDMNTDKQENISSADITRNEFEEERNNITAQNLAVPNDGGASIGTTENVSLLDRFMQDSTGNSISTLVLVGMIFSVVFAGILIIRPNHVLSPWPNWIFSIILIIGLAVAIYMAYVEISRSEAVCGPVGDCNTVQQSQYASLFGFVPMGLLGVLGYLVISIVWLVSVFGGKKWRKRGLIVLWGLSLFGTLFSIYLTFLEPFVIGASCAWCLTSAVVMTLLFWNSTANIQYISGKRRLINL